MDLARDFLITALPSRHRDDRFGDEWATGLTQKRARVWSSVGLIDGEPRSLLIGQAHDTTLTIDSLFDPGSMGLEDLATAQLVDLVETGGPQTRATVAEVWSKPVPDWLPAAAAAAGLTSHRGLYQMRRPLPSDIEPVTTRSFKAEDTEELRLVNNRSFANHPSQGNQSPARWDRTIKADWFRPAGTRILEGPDGGIIGFCITKIHDQPSLGEIYVIGLNPSVHGQGLGAPMTAAGLDWLHDQGLDTAMLYVEDNNTPAVRTYERLGFEVFRHDRAWRVSLGPVERA